MPKTLAGASGWYLGVRMRQFLLAAVTVAVTALPLHAQRDEVRYELGRRLRLFESEWDAVTEAAARKRTIPHLKQATTDFFGGFLSGKQEEAGRGLDRARLALQHETLPAERLWAESLVARPSHRLVDRTAIELTLARFYPAKEKLPEGAMLRVQIVGEGKAVDQPIGELPVKLTLPLKDVKEGDHVLRTDIVVKDRVLARSEQTLSVVDGLKERLEKAGKAVQALDETPSTDHCTAGSLLTSLERLAEGKTLETDYPASRLLGELEELLRVRTTRKPYHGKDRAGQFWLTLAVKDRRVPVRVQVPAAAKEGKPLPLVIALHGAGGSENMFFDGYGNGVITKLCAQRGWLLVATRNGLADGVIDELARLYPVDRKKVFLVGHSMGAGQALAAVNREPEKYAAVAALGGGGVIRSSEAITTVAFFVGVGKEDFLALRNTRPLEEGLKRAKVVKAIYKEYDDVEHLVIVQVCLPEVCKLFDEVARR